MAFDKSTNMQMTVGSSPVRAFAAFVGAGAAILTVPTDAQAVAAGLPRGSANIALPRGTTNVSVVVTRTGVGDHTYTFATRASPSVIWFAVAQVEGASNLAAEVKSKIITAGQLIVRVLTFTAAGAATDLASGTDFLTIMIDGSNSNVVS